jgi:copper chaperone
METIKLYLDNIKCSGCANSIIKRLHEMEGVESASVNVEEGYISFDSLNENMIDNVKSAMAKMGYPEKGTSDFIDNAKSYVSCMIGRMS